MKFKSILLRNFQAHARKFFAFAPGITTIVGPTDKGKSALLRALRWACLNDFSGEDFIREGAASVFVRVTTTRNRITRSKGKGGNSYKMADKDKTNSVEYKAFGQSIPEPVIQALRVSDINFQAQHDAPFWFCESAPEVSRQLNAVIDLSIIDTALANVSSEVRRSTERESLTQERVLALTQDWEDIKGLEERVAQYRTIARLEKAAVAGEDECHRLAELGATGRSLREEVHSRQAQAEEGQALVEQAKVFLVGARRYRTLVELTTSARLFQGSIVDVPNWQPVEDAWEKACITRKRWLAISDLLEEAIELSEQARVCDQLYSTHEDLFHAATKGQNCPLCGKTL